jgi:uncharacterized protein YaaW (UPF0174 family)
MKKYNAKRTAISIGYGFLDGTEATVSVHALSTKEFDDLNANIKESTPNQLNEKTLRIMLDKNDQMIVDKIVKEQYDEGVLVDFVSALLKALDEEKKGKLND